MCHYTVQDKKGLKTGFETFSHKDVSIDQYVACFHYYDERATGLINLKKKGLFKNTVYLMHRNIFICVIIVLFRCMPKYFYSYLLVTICD